MDKFLTKFNFSQPSASTEANRSQLINELNLGPLEADPGERVTIAEYNPRIRDEVRRHYIRTGPCQSLLKKYPTTQIGNRGRQFVSNWYKGIINACAKETVKAIIGDLNGDYFGILVDESKYISHKEQMALMLRYVDKNSEVVERFISLVHVSDTSACSLKKEIYSLLSNHSLSPSKIRRQGYDGASNMRGEINGLKTLIKKDSPSSYHIYYFAHQLQLILVAIAKKHGDVEDFFDHVTNVLNAVGGSFKHRNLIRQSSS
ncbi:uncharacterized protein LOC132637307 [Lycium barbarum]|uniref:uncharacterized protein LOC132637307 n=1 Tax=Lycium barbarum TaxID=112863 RepID=UPI00293F70EE|nr:uncharacterized protein LOC132637307 [Lycium barbarum]